MDLEKLHLSLIVKGKQNRVQLMMLEEEEEELDEEAALLDEEAAMMAEEMEAEAEAVAVDAAVVPGGGGEGGEEEKVKVELEGGGGGGAMDLDSSVHPPPFNDLGSAALVVSAAAAVQSAEAVNDAISDSAGAIGMPLPVLVKEEGGETQGLPLPPSLLPPLDDATGLPAPPKPVNPILRSLEAQKIILMRSAQLHLAPSFLERSILAANKETADRASERMLRTLPPDLADKARQAGPTGNIAVLPPMYSCPQEAPGWVACEERHAENIQKGAVVAFLKVRAMLAAAKQKALADQYSEYASQMVAKAAAVPTSEWQTLDFVLEDHPQTSNCPASPLNTHFSLLPPLVPYAYSFLAPTLFFRLLFPYFYSHYYYLPPGRRKEISTSQPTTGRFNRNSSSGTLGPAFNPHHYGGAINSDYEEALVMQNFEAVEMLQTMCYLPDQCADPWERRWKAYDDRNGLQEDPLYDEKARRAAKAWTAKEKELFKEKILIYPKGKQKHLHVMPCHVSCLLYHLIEVSWR